MMYTSFNWLVFKLFTYFLVDLVHVDIWKIFVGLFARWCASWMMRGVWVFWASASSFKPGFLAILNHLQTIELRNLLFIYILIRKTIWSFGCHLDWLVRLVIFLHLKNSLTWILERGVFTWFKMTLGKQETLIDAIGSFVWLFVWRDFVIDTVQTCRSCAFTELSSVHISLSGSVKLVVLEYHAEGVLLGFRKSWVDFLTLL